MDPEQILKHWRLEVDENDFAWLYLDQQGTGTNVLSAEVLEELDTVLDEVTRSSPKGLVVASGKPSGFIAGADVSAFRTIKEPQQAVAWITRTHEIFDRLEALPFPTVARIDGFCLGGGLELALACDYRVALDSAATRLGLPEVLLGIHPGFGGTGRLPRLIGAPAAMELMLSGRTLDAQRAKRLGIVDRAVPKRQLHNAVLGMLKTRPEPRKPGRLAKLASHKWVRPALAWYLRRQVAKRAFPEHYPAPYALIDLWRQYGGDPQRMIAAEADSLGHLITGQTAQNLVRAFFLRERLKSAGRAIDYRPKRIHVIGAGIMGGDIAAWCALKGYHVTLQDRAPEFIAPSLKRAHDLFKKRIRDRRLRQAALDRLVPDHKGEEVERADLVIEAIIEDLDAKQALYAGLEPRLKSEALLATNTSSIPLEKLCDALRRPERLVGVHFFNPVAKMQLVEVIGSEITAQDTLDKAMSFVRLIDRLPLPVKSSPGFLVNRILMPYLLESVYLLEEGVGIEAIDKAAADFGMPMGPIELADTVGLDICLSVGEMLANSQGLEVPNRLRELVSKGHLGRKTGRGFYRYKKGKIRRRAFTKDSVTDHEITDRLILTMLNESAACLREKVVDAPDLLDAGMIFGTGFAPFRGGPIHYASDRGIHTLIKRLKEFEKKLGQRFAPDPGWDTI